MRQLFVPFFWSIQTLQFGFFNSFSIWCGISFFENMQNCHDLDVCKRTPQLWRDKVISGLFPRHKEDNVFTYNIQYFFPVCNNCWTSLSKIYCRIPQIWRDCIKAVTLVLSGRTLWKWIYLDMLNLCGLISFFPSNCWRFGHIICMYCNIQFSWIFPLT